MLTMTCPTCGGTPCINPDFCRLCRDADHRKTPSPERLAQLRRLMSGNISLDRAQYEIDRTVRERSEAPEATLHAALHELRTYGLSQLNKPDCQRRLSDLSAAQLKKLIASLQQRRGQYPGVLDELLTTLVTIYDARVMTDA